MSLEGNAQSGGVLRGKVNSLDLLTISAYGVAVKNGFEGTEAEWLASLKGEKGEPGIQGEKGEPGADYVLTDADKEEIAGMVNSGANVDGLTAEEKGLILALFEKTAYTEDMSATYNQLATLWSVGGDEPIIPDEPDEPDVTTYTISLDLVNVSSSNSATSVTEGESYTATLTAADGYELSTVTVTMGGVDVTVDVYADGVVTIESVTGNVEIMASASVVEESEPELVADGLLAFWDLRNLDAGADIIPSNGETSTYRLSPVNDWNSITTDDRGTLFPNGTYGGITIKKLGEDGAFTNMEHGTAFTVVTLGYSPENVAMIGPSGIYSRDGFNAWYLHSKYTKTDGTDATAVSKQTNVVPQAGTYCPFIYTVDGSNSAMYLYGTKYNDVSGEDYDGFDHWVDGPFTIRSIKNYPSAYLTAVVIYNRALTQEEIVEMGEYLKTLEVTA